MSKDKKESYEGPLVEQMVERLDLLAQNYTQFTAITRLVDVGAYANALIFAGITPESENLTAQAYDLARKFARGVLQSAKAVRDTFVPFSQVPPQSLETILTDRESKVKAFLDRHSTRSA